jgi:hypothetical protein
MHDASYWRCLQLHGQQAQLVSLLRLCSDAQCLQQWVLQRAGVLCGAAEVELVLHQPGCFPERAIGPVKLLWHPPAAAPVLQQQQREQQREQQQQQQGQQQQQQQHTARSMDVDGGGARHKQQGSRRERRLQGQQQQRRTLWMWAHPAYATELQQALQAGSTLLEQQQQQQQLLQGSKQEGVPPAPCVAVCDVSDHLRRLELVGPSAGDVLASVINQQQQQGAAGEPSIAGPAGNAVWQALQQLPAASWPRAVPDGAVLGLAALDPRLLPQPCRHQQPPDAAAAPAAGAASQQEQQAAAADALRQLRAHWPSNGALRASSVVG